MQTENIKRTDPALPLINEQEKKYKLNKRSILSKSFQFAFFTFLSRVLGFAREFLQIKYLGSPSAVSDAFITAFRIPTSLRKIFAEGALSAAFVPTIIKIVRSEGKAPANRLMSSGFLFFETIVLLLTIFVWSFPSIIVKLMASGFSYEQMMLTTSYLRILFPFIFLISCSALLAGALQSVNHFFMTAFMPPFLNVIYVGTLLVCMKYGLSVEYLCIGILFGGFLQLLLFFAFYFKNGFGFGMPDRQSFIIFKSVLSKFRNCLLGAGVMELNMIIDGNIGSYLSKGSVTLLYLGTRFMQIPLAIVAISFSTVLLSHLSRIVLYAPKRLSFYLLEATKFVIWATLPLSLFLMFISHRLFAALFALKKMNNDNVDIAAGILIVMSTGLLFFAIDKIFKSIFYSLGDTWLPAYIGIIATSVNLVGNVASLFYLGKYAIYGIAASTVAYGVVCVALAFYFLRTRYGYRFYLGNFAKFMGYYILQVSIVAFMFLQIHNYIFEYLKSINSFFYLSWGYWFIVLPLITATMGFLFLTRKFFGIRLYFLER